MQTNSPLLDVGGQEGLVLGTRDRALERKTETNRTDNGATDGLLDDIGLFLLLLVSCLLSFALFSILSLAFSLRFFFSVYIACGGLNARGGSVFL